jgi:hypothetical protein
MLYVIHCANHAELTYRGGQGPIVHLEADVHRVVKWANANNRRWAFSLSNAGAYYTQFRANLNQLNDVNWPAVLSNDFRDPDYKEGKQAEFLVHQTFPWELVDRIGVLSHEIAQRAANALHHAAHRPAIQVLPAWYY